MHRVVQVGRVPHGDPGIAVGNTQPLVLIAGPCQIETLDHALMMADAIKGTADRLGVPFIFKSSYDKANRTSASTPRGVGMVEGLRILEEVKRRIGVPVTTDFHTPEDAHPVGSVVDILQVPAMQARNTDLLIAAGSYGAVVNVKKAQHMAPADMAGAWQKVRNTGNDSILLTERGTFFGYGRLVNDMRSLPIMGDIAPVIFDATHSTQLPSAYGEASGGEPKFIEPLARAAVAVGIAGIFLECHQEPQEAPSDGACMLPLHRLPTLLASLVAIDEVVKGRWS